MDIYAIFKQILDNEQKSSAIGIIKDLDLAKDRSVLRAEVSLWPDEVSVIARVSWDAVAPNAGIFMFPTIGDLVLVEFPEDDPDDALLTRRLSSREDTIPATASDGSLVMRSKDGLKSWITSNTRINLSKGDTEPIENLVLGQKFKATYIKHMEKLLDLLTKLITQRETDIAHTHVTIGLPSTPPVNSALMTAEKALLNTLKSQIQALKVDDVESDQFLSDLAYTEK